MCRISIHLYKIGKLGKLAYVRSITTSTAWVSNRVCTKEPLLVTTLKQKWSEKHVEDYAPLEQEAQLS